MTCEWQGQHLSTIAKGDKTTLRWTRTLRTGPRQDEDGEPARDIKAPPRA